MEKREIAKFLSGFFTAATLVDIGVVLFSIYSPFKILGNVLDFQIWMTLLATFIVLAILFAFGGWGAKTGRKYITLLLLMITVFSFYITFDVLKVRNINLFQASAISLLAENEAVNENNQSAASNTQKESNEFSFSLGADKYDGGKVIAIDAEGNFYITGYFQGTINLDVLGGLKEITSVGNSLISSATDIYVAKYSPQRELLWGFSIGSAGKDMPIDLKLDKDNNFYLAGYFGGLADFNPDETIEYNLDAGAGRDAFLAKYDRNGNFVWSKKIGNPEKIPFTDNDIRFEEARSIALDNNGNIYVAGIFDGTINLDEPNEITPDNSLTSNAKIRNIFVAKYDSSGKYLKGISVGGSVQDEATALQIGTEGDIYLAGYFIGRSNFDFKNNKNKAASVFSDDDFDIFAAKYDRDFNFIWVKKWGGEGNDYLANNGLVIDKSDNFYIVGDFSGTMPMGKNLVSRGGSDVFFAKIDKTGQIIFAKSFGGSKNDQASKIQLDQAGNIYIAGLFKSVCDFNPGKGGQPLISVSDGLASDGFLAKYTGEGNYLWARDLGGEVSLDGEVQAVEDVAFGADNQPVVTGYFYKKIDFHSTESLNLESQGLTDVLVVKYNEAGEIE